MATVYNSGHAGQAVREAILVPPPALPLHADADLRRCLRLNRVELDRTQSRAVLDAVLHGRTIEAIKVVREGAKPRLGLKEAKDLVDEFSKTLKSTQGDRFRR